MLKRVKKSLTLVMALVMVLSVVCGSGMFVEAEDAMGETAEAVVSDEGEGKSIEEVENLIESDDGLPEDEQADISVEEGTDIQAQSTDNEQGLEVVDESGISVASSSSTISWRNLPTNNLQYSASLGRKYKNTDVNFYVNLTSKIANSNSGTGDTDSDNFTKSVCSTTVSQYPGTVEYEMDNDGAYVVIQGASDSAYQTDLNIRELAPGAEGYKGFKLTKFPTDEEVFNLIKRNWYDYTKNQGLKVGNITIQQNDLTTENYAIRWYVFKYNTGDAWHVDGILVPKYGRMTVTKTFIGANDIVSTIAGDFAINVSGENNAGLKQSYKLTLKNYDATNAELGYDNIVVDEQNNTTTYTWTIDVLEAEYTVTESGGEVENWSSSAKYSKNPDLTSEDNRVTDKDYPDDGFSIKCVTKASDAGSAAMQSVALNNTYTRQTCTMTVEKAVTGNMGDTNKAFEFTFTNGSLTESFSLKAGESKIFTVNKGDNVKIVETNTSDGYTTTWVEGDKRGDGKEYTGTITGDTTITFTNDRTVSPPTGIELRTLPYVFMVVFGLGIAAILILRRRKRIF